MVKEVSNKCLSHEDGYKKATNYSSLGMVMYEVVKELRETIRSLQAKIEAQDTIISELKSVSGGGGGNIS
jgi:predicted RNase H-like nuclease (RuvC/YqgF family)